MDPLLAAAIARREREHEDKRKRQTLVEYCPKCGRKLRVGRKGGKWCTKQAHGAVDV